ncbi:nitronate monooxygenase family protein [Comamonadaceae bacterium G21597-S1]|nr:nitronate monooxygenase family protein [Comamonadaceae bacterium G21597-S1]
MRTRITEMLGIRYPIIQGGMQWVGTAEMASAVSNAGGLGILGALTQPTVEHLAREIERCHGMTQRPFGVNVTMLRTVNPPPYERIFRTIVDGGVRIVETAGNVPEEVFRGLKESGVLILHKCTSVRHGLAAQRRGVDVISIDGFECAGHPGEDDVPGLVLIPAAVRALSIPIIASGGIADGRGLAAALSLGADGVNMGTRFVLTQEAPVHESVKQALLRATERDTRVIMRNLKNSARVFANAIAEEVIDVERRRGTQLVYEDIQPLVAGARGRQALQSGEVDAGLVWAGMALGLIDDIPSCDELIERMVRECRSHLSRALACFLPEACLD